MRMFTRRPLPTRGGCGPFLLMIIISQAHGGRDTLKTLDTLVVRTSRPISPIVDQKKIEESLGIVEDLNTVLLQKPGVQSIPEAGSMLLVNGEGPFDNLYLVRQIPVFPPSNFAGHTFADRSVVTLALPNTISFSTSDMAGKWSGASGSVISIDPCILKTNNRLPRPEGAMSFGTLSTDFSLNIPARRARDRYQLSYYVPIAGTLFEKSLLTGESNDLGYGIPAAAWNVRTLGEQAGKKIRFQQLVWGGINTYAKDIDEAGRIQRGGSAIKVGPGSSQSTIGKKYPWGMAIVSAYDSISDKPWKISFGGSRQNFFEARRLMKVTPYKIVEKNNCAISLQCGILQGDSWAADISALGEYDFWSGDVFIKHAESSPPPIASAVKPDSTALSLRRISKNAQIHVGFKRTFSGFQLNVNSNQGFFNSGEAFFLDPGVSLGFPAFTGAVELSAGITSAPADIRGLPGPQFDGTISRTYQTYVTTKQRLNKNFNFSVGVFLKYKDRLFQYEDSPASFSWDIGRTASLMAAGGSCQIELKAGKRFAMGTNAAVERSKVSENRKGYFSDWDVPVSSTTSLSFAIIPDKMKLYFIGNFSKGRPYRDVIAVDSAFGWGPAQMRLPTYKCVDLKWEWRQPTDGNLITEYDGFILIQNIFNRNNVREYQWMPEKTAISLAPITFNIGMRVNFRLLYW